MTRKIVALILALAMVLALGLTACGKAEEEKPADTTAAEKEKETTKAPDESAATDEEEFAAETVDWYCDIDMTNTPDFEEYVWPMLNEYFQEKLNITAVWHGFPDSEYGTKFNAAVTSGTGIDLMFMSKGTTGFSVWYERNALEMLDDLLLTYAQELMADMPDYAFKTVSYDGHIYGMPTIKKLVVDVGVYYNETMMDELGVHEAWDDTYFDSADDLEEIFYDVKAKRDEAHPDWAGEPVAPLYNSTLAYMRGDELTKGVYTKVPGSGSFEDQESRKAFNIYGTTDYSDMIHLVYNWVQDGIYEYDAQNFETSEHLKTGAIFAYFEHGNLSDEYEKYADYGWYQRLRHPNQPFAQANYALNCVHAIYANTTDAKKVAAMRLYNTLAEDQYVATSIRFGVEDLHWKHSYIDDLGQDRITFTFEGSRNIDETARNYYFWFMASIGNMCKAWLPDTQDDDFFQQLTDCNNRALPSEVMGFSLNTSNIENEIAAIANVIDEYHNDMMYGMLAEMDARIDDFNKTLEANGIQTIIDEADTQIANFDFDSVIAILNSGE